MTHPIPIGRRAALHDAAFWRPLKGLVSAIAEQFAMEPEKAGTLLYEGMGRGEIGHRIAAAKAQDWIVTPRGAELARLSGLRYDEHIDLCEGTMHPPGGRTYPLEVYWPDVERMIRQPSSKTIEGTAEETECERPKTGPRPERQQRTEAAMRTALDTGAITFAALMALRRKELPARFGGAAETTCWKAREGVKAERRKNVSELQPNRDKRQIATE